MKGDFLYAIDLEEPSVPLIIEDLRAVPGSEIKMLGCDRRLDWHQQGDNLVIEEIPEPLPCDYAWCFKIQVK